MGSDLPDVPAIDSDGEWEKASSDLSRVIERRKDILSELGAAVDSARLSYRKILADKDELDKPLKEAEEILRKTMSLYPGRGNELFGVRKKIDFVVADESILPRRFVQPNNRVIREVVDAMGDMANIPGVDLFEIYPVYARNKKEK